MSRAFGLAFLLATSICLVASADEPIQHVVKKGDTCASIAQQYYGDSRLVEVLHKANPALSSVPPPHNLKEGSIVLVPPKPAGESAPPDARLTTVRNRVDVLAPETRPGKPKDPLFRGNRVSTEAASSADVTFRDESQVKLGERTLVVILGDVKSAAKKEDPAPSVNATQLVTGNLRAFMSGKSKSEIAVQTSAANVSVAGGEAQVGSDERKTSRLAVYQGQSSISAQGVKREVVPGFGSKAELGKPPTVPKPLPPAPIWTKLPMRVLLDRWATAGSAPSMVGEYDLPNAATAAEWRIQVGRDERFRDLLLDTRVSFATKRFEGKTPGPGHYWLRVSAIDDDHFEGPFGEAAKILVVHPKISVEDATHRRIELDPPDAACMRVGNVRLTWVKAPIVAEVLEPVRLRCSSTETAPTTLLDVDRLDDFPAP